MTAPRSVARALGLTTALALLAACTPGQFDWDFRRNPGNLNTSEAARNVTADRPAPDGRGIISYPGYQVAVAQRGDTVTTVASRVGVSPGELAQFNALRAEDPLRPGEVLALPTRVAAAPVPGTGTGTGAGIDVTTIATTAIDRAAPASGSGAAAAPPPFAVASGPEPSQHKVARGETAFTIARTYNVSPKALAEWNGLGPDMGVREGQILLIPVAVASRPGVADDATAPGEGTPTPVPPSAGDPLPDEDVEAASTATPEGTPDSPDLGQDRTAASAAAFALPVPGNIIRGFSPPKSLGIDITAPGGTPVKAAADGTVAAVTKDTDGTAIVILRHADGLLTVYGGVDGIAVKKGDSVKRGTNFATVRAAANPFLHFEVRKGFDAVDPMAYLQ